ncbi:MAG: glycosyl transferase [Deltaproteobacteria bacterium CG_4_8_14_3_um_filter_45_9]|nr:MAG: glycosyl transferase [Deltaproteobacteria bacterium CG03_land_8_20_14_0_80_45_14]PIX22125.1 MAG: glycosyl transferase [Deltaproteobacteria bacterium CG_4_8_14_3_um_filter_45_9]
MSDFFQPGVITTLHRLKKANVERMEMEMEFYSRHNPIALILPSLYSELKEKALKTIVSEIQKVKYINQVIITLGKADRREFEHTKEFFSVLPQQTTIIWNDGDRIRSLYEILNKNDISAGEDGKGRSTWMAFGFVLASEKSNVIALHDCDILSYDREFLARLCYPVVNPNLGYEFCKGYYARVTNKMHGRVTRLFVTPLIRSLERLLGHLPFLVYLDSFRYPLAGEFSMITDLARINRIPWDWGLEVGVLSEVFRNCSLRRICQVNLTENYEHKHQELSSDDPGKGLLRMSIDIAKNLFRNLASEGIDLSESLLKTLKATYLRTAQETISKYHDDAAINGLDFDRHEEGVAVETFTKGIELASKALMEDPLSIPLIPNWSRVTSAIPDFLERLKNAVDDDNT